MRTNPQTRQQRQQSQAICLIWASIVSLIAFGQQRHDQAKQFPLAPVQPIIRRIQLGLIRVFNQTFVEVLIADGNESERRQIDIDAPIWKAFPVEFLPVAGLVF